MKKRQNFFYILILFTVLSATPVQAGVGIGVKAPADPVRVPYGENVTVEIHVYNVGMDRDNVFVVVGLEGIVREDGSPVPHGWFENIEIYPPLENFYIGIFDEILVRANFLMPNLTAYELYGPREEPEVPPEIENYADVYTMLHGWGEGFRWAPARRVFITMDVSEEALGGTYILKVDVVATSVRPGGEGLGAALSVLATPEIRVIAPPPPPLPIPVLLTILAIAAISALAAVLAWAVKKGKVKI
jgi:hypothetical protein